MIWSHLFVHNSVRPFKSMVHQDIHCTELVFTMTKSNIYNFLSIKHNLILIRKSFIYQSFSVDNVLKDNQVSRCLHMKTCLETCCQSYTQMIAAWVFSILNIIGDKTSPCLTSFVFTSCLWMTIFREEVEVTLIFFVIHHMTGSSVTTRE